jgi:hypothetical protein
MGKRDVTEAQLAIQLAETFGRTPPAWAVEARRAELREVGEPAMSANEALNVKCGEAFGRVPDRARLQEAEKVLAGVRSTVQEQAALGREATGLVEEIAELAETRLGMSPERGRLYAQSEALRAKEVSSRPGRVVESLRSHRDALKKQERRRSRAATFVDGTRVD